MINNKYYYFWKQNTLINDFIYITYLYMMIKFCYDLFSAYSGAAAASESGLNCRL